jgi:hypothetical protein
MYTCNVHCSKMYSVHTLLPCIRNRVICFNRPIVFPLAKRRSCDFYIIKLLFEDNFETVIKNYKFCRFGHDFEFFRQKYLLSTCSACAEQIQAAVEHDQESTDYCRIYTSRGSTDCCRTDTPLQGQHSTVCCKTRHVLG